MSTQPLTPPSERPLYVVIMTHVEGDEPEPEGSPTCIEDLSYQVEGLPPPGQAPKNATFEVDIVGTEFLHEFLQSYTDSRGQPPKLFIEPAAEFWQTEADPRYGGKLFRTYDYLALGCEFGIQGHNIAYAGESFCWYKTPPTPEGIRRKLSDMHTEAERLLHRGQKVNAGLTFTGGHKLESPPLAPDEAERLIDHIAYGLGYRISFEDYDGHLQSKPDGRGESRPAYYVYEADYGDRVRMVKIDFNGAVTANCPGKTPRCETAQEAIARFDRTLAAKAQDDDPTHVYFFAFTVHSNLVWIDFHMAAAGFPMIQEGAGLQALMDAIEARKNAGARIEYVTPRILAEHFWAVTGAQR